MGNTKENKRKAETRATHNLRFKKSKQVVPSANLGAGVHLLRPAGQNGVNLIFMPRFYHEGSGTFFDDTRQMCAFLMRKELQPKEGTESA